MNISEEKLYVAEGMKQFGGSFVKALGKALIKADDINASKIAFTWSDIYNKYKRLGLYLEEQRKGDLK